MDRLLGVILGEAFDRLERSNGRTAGGRNCACTNLPLDLSSVAGRSLAGQECQRAVARRLKLSVRHVGDLRGDI